ncbi:MAG: hypothetical protein J3Q66DRAFT_320425 [Benniella sp.]|nr:MAG: hypothetical protein J3Q66DRAFT_320425 [Benniella sp.]
MPSPRVIRWGLSGFGPRHALYIIHQAIVILAHRDQLTTIRDRGIHFILHYTIFEKLDVACDGIGAAFQADCDAAVNTSITMPTMLPKILGGKVDPTIMALVDLASTARPVLETEYQTILAELEHRNPPAAILFKKAFRFDHEFNNAVACMTRGKWGRIQLDNIHSGLKYIRENVPEMSVDIHYSHEVVDVDFSNRTRPRLVVSWVGESSRRSYDFDFVSFAHGTPLSSPLKPNVASKAYSLTPNHDTLREYLRECGVLDDKLQLIPGKKIACTGLSLSFYDYATLLLAFLPGFQLDNSPTGFTFHGSHAAEYKDLLTVISRADRGPAPPRTGLDMNWRGGGRFFFSARDMHVLRLQRHSNWLPIAYEFLEAHIGRSLHKVPRQVNSHRTIAEYMTSYRDDNHMYLNKEGITETDLLRAGYHAFGFGTGIAVDVDDAEEKLLQEAPITRNGRFGLPMMTASGFEMSSPDSHNSTQENIEFFKRWEDLRLFLSASPVVIHNTVAEMFTTGIATHQKGKFDEIDISPTTGKVIFQGQEFDALLAPMLMKRENDPILNLTRRFVKEVVPGVPEYGKGGFFKTKDGKPINAFDGGMGGWGTTLPSNGRTVGARWHGLTTSHLSATEYSTQHAYHTLALAIALCLHPDESPIETVTDVFHATLPEPKEFDDEVNSFRSDWEDLQDRHFFLRLAARLAGDNAERYYGISNHIFSKDTRDRFIRQLRGQEKAVYDTLKREFVRKEYDPPTCQQYEARFAGYTTPQYEAILHEIFRRAEMQASLPERSTTKMEFDPHHQPGFFLARL